MLHLSACDLAASEHVSICSWTCMADWLLLHILARMVILSQHWYNSSAGDGSLLSMGIARSPSKARCGLAPVYLACWSACLADLTHALANPLTVGSADLRFHVRCPKLYRSQQTEHLHTVGRCQSKGLWGCLALKTSLSTVK